MSPLHCSGIQCASMSPHEHVLTGPRFTVIMQIQILSLELSNVWKQFLVFLPIRCKCREPGRRLFADRRFAADQEVDVRTCFGKCDALCSMVRVYICTSSSLPWARPSKGWPVHSPSLSFSMKENPYNLKPEIPLN